MSFDYSGFGACHRHRHFFTLYLTRYFVLICIWPDCETTNPLHVISLVGGITIIISAAMLIIFATLTCTLRNTWCCSCDKIAAVVLMCTLLL